MNGLTSYLCSQILSYILRINVTFQRYLQKYDRSRRHSSGISPDMNGSHILLNSLRIYVFHSKVIFKSMTGPDDTRDVKYISGHEWVNMLPARTYSHTGTYRAYTGAIFMLPSAIPILCVYIAATYRAWGGLPWALAPCSLRSNFPNDHLYS